MLSLWCVYGVGSENLAKKSGGAIAVQGNAKVAVTVLQSAFDSNAVETPPDAGTVDLTVRLNTVRVMGILPATPASLIISISGRVRHRSGLRPH